MLRNQCEGSGLVGALTGDPRMLTLQLVDRLLASTIVPREAKLAAVESWRRELAAMRDKHYECRRIERRLAAASRALAAPRPWATAA